MSILVASLLVGCGSTPTIEKQTMLDRYHKRMSDTDNQVIQTLSKHYELLEQRNKSTGLAERLANPELTMTYFPRATGDGTGYREHYVKKFSMYSRVHYRIGGQ